MRATKVVTAGCFAAPLGDCDGGKLTAEHYITKELLRRFGRNFMVSGLSWMTEARRLTESTLVSKILCGHHNHGLSDLDGEVVRLFDVLQAAHAERAVGWRSLDGELLERWALKVMCGLAASGNYGGGRGQRAEIPLDLLLLLFGRMPMTGAQGLYYVGDAIDGFDADRLDVAFMRAQSPDPGAGEIYGIVVKLLGFQFVVTLKQQPFQLEKQRVWHRPAGFIVGDKRNERGCLALRWSRPASGAVLRIKIGGADLHIQARQHDSPDPDAL